MTKEEFLAMSLPYGLKFTISDKHDAIIYTLNNEKAVFISNDKEVKPIIHPLSDITKPITHKGETFVPLHEIIKMTHCKRSNLIERDEIVFSFLSLDIWSKLIEWHFDIAGLIEKGEAIDVNTLDKNPYA